MKGLDKLNIGEEATVIKLEKRNRRLEDLGLVEGTKIKCILKSPLGDPIAYIIRGAVIAIRKEMGKNILVEVMDRG